MSDFDITLRDDTLNDIDIATLMMIAYAASHYAGMVPMPRYADEPVI